MYINFVFTNINDTQWDIWKIEVVQLLEVKVHIIIFPLCPVFAVLASQGRCNFRLPFELGARRSGVE